MKKLFVMFTVFALSCSFIGCGAKENDAATTTAQSSEASADKADTEAAENEEATEAVVEAAADETADTENTGLKSGVYQYKYTEEMEGEIITNYNYLALKDDNTGFWSVQDMVPITWDENGITSNDTVFEYTMQGEDVLLKEETGDVLYEYKPNLGVQEFIDNFDNPEYRFSIEGMADVPNSFIEEKLGVTSFESYDEIINSLSEGQAYAFIQLKGYDGDLLVITEYTYNYDDNTKACIEGYIYAMIDGKVRYVSVAYSDGTGRPLAVADGVLYHGTQHEVQGDFFNPEGTGVMLKFAVSEDFTDDGSTFSGFIRETNSFDEANERTDVTEEDYRKLWDDYMSAEVVNFTVVE